MVGVETKITTLPNADIVEKRKTLCIFLDLVDNRQFVQQDEEDDLESLRVRVFGKMIPESYAAFMDPEIFSNASIHGVNSLFFHTRKILAERLDAFELQYMEKKCKEYFPNVAKHFTPQHILEAVNIFHILTWAKAHEEGQSQIEQINYLLKRMTNVNWGLDPTSVLELGLSINE